MFALYLAMKLFSHSALVATVTAAGLLAAAVPTSACMFSKLSDSASSTSPGGPSELLSNTPDSKALGIALGGVGVIAALLTGGVVFYRKQQLAHLADQSVSIAESEFDLTETIAEETVISSTTEEEIEKELVLTR